MVDLRYPQSESSDPSYYAGGTQDLLVYDPTDMAWTDLSAAASGTPPSARFGHGFTSAGDKLYVHGGSNLVASSLSE